MCGTDKELCVNVGSMLCNVFVTPYPTIFKTSVETALNRIGVRLSNVVLLAING
jgi:hypothetical protein